ncbi:hypothetical protein Moror_10879 [Moniliophthora roreri MCA 2997]|uniref:Uncharacterized protein n=1 Tax=Moniliophthora roreri (strain MCA 2997) TaxID=1381753 RepID=V2X660_MONRO|nr:hypothetical protein Moror_10879 [Moniliophthora roreri MCA 2997]
MSFTNTSHIVITGENTFNHVQGNQVNGTTNAGTVNFNASQERTKYNQFREVIHGDMIMLKEIHTKEITNREWGHKYGKVTGKHRVRRTMYIVKVYPDRQSKFTAIMYEGEDADCIWEKEFEKFSHTSPLVAQLFGINRSEIPMLIFHDELIPCAHFFNEKSIWMKIYINYLRRNMGCWTENLWMSTASGVLFSGPDSPSAPGIRSDAVKSIVVPATVDMLKDDTCFRFFINFGSRVDHCVLECTCSSYRLTYLDSLLPATAEDHQSKDSDHPNWSSVTHPYLRSLWRNPLDHLPMNIIGRLQFDTVYSPLMEAVTRWPTGARSLWKWQKYNGTGLAEETVLDDGMTRFKLDLTREKGVHFDAVYSHKKFRRGWLSQSCRVFDAIEVAERKEDFFIINPPRLMIQSTRRCAASPILCKDEYPVKETPPTPIYLFLHPLPMSISELVSWMDGHFYFWSFGRTGQSRMSEEECERWGLPVLTLFTSSSVWLYSWPAHVYTALRDWQMARGFDPATFDWARHMSYPEFEILSDLGQFKEVRKVQEESKASSSWWEAFAGSGISAFGI